MDPVVVVGAGPTGLTAALLLALRGIPVVLLERHAGAYALPRAVHLDDEVHRILQSAGVAEEFHRLSRPARGLRLLDRRHRVIAEFARSPAGGAHGWPQANMFDQPDLERLLRERLAEQPQALLRTGVEVRGVRPGPVVLLEDLATGEREELRAAAVLGCDGAGSVVREAVGTGEEDLRFEEPWLVVDVRCPTQLDVWDGVHQVCDGRRAATFMQVGPDRYRWEFRLAPDESAEELGGRLPELVEPWLAGTPSARLEVLRSAGYTFRARLADRWGRGRVFLLGDAAHLTPPFIGQGLGAGLRDAANLTWKLAAVLHGRAPEELLASYAAERRPHARAVIRTAVLAGWAMTGGQGPAAAVRRGALAVLCRIPAFRTQVLDRGTPALGAGALVAQRAPLVGTLAPQPRVLSRGREVRLDDVLGPGFAVLTRAEVDPALARVAARLGAPVVRLVASDGVLAGWLRRGGASTVVLRPDRAVLLAARSVRAPGAELERTGSDVLRLVAGAVRGAP